MDQPQSSKPAGALRPVRRSLAEFALPASGMAEELPAAASRQNMQSSTAIDDERPHVTHPLLNENDGIAPDEIRSTVAPKIDGVENDVLLHQFEDMTLAAAKAAKDYRFLMLEHMKINMTAALNCVNGLATASSGIASAAHCVPFEQEINRHPEGNEEAAPTGGKAADEYRAKAFELMTSNINTSLEYAQRLAHVKTPSEFVELTTTQARKQFETMVKQTSELGSIAQRLTPHDIASMTASFAKLLGERKE